MVPNASVLACRREERVQKAVSVDHHGPGDARLSGVLNPLSHAECDYVVPRATCSTLAVLARIWTREIEL